jgi:hypothetical protein
VRLSELIRKIEEQGTEGKNSLSELIPIPEGLNDWLPELELFLRACRNRVGEQALKDRFLEIICKGIDRSDKQYLRVISDLSPKASEKGTHWLQGIVNEVTDGAFQIIPFLNTQP